MGIKVTKKSINQVIDTFVDIENKMGNRRKILKIKYDTESTLFTYLRVSSRVQEKEGTSLKTQREKGELKGKELGLNVIHFNEKGKSSKYDSFINREKIDELLQLVKLGKVKHLYVFDINRLSRNRDTGYYIKSILYKSKVNVYTDSGKYDFGSSTDRFIFELFSNLSVLENDRRRKWSMLGKIQSIRMGRWKGGVVNFGYDLKDKKVIVNKIEKSIVNKMFRMYDKGQSTRDIQKWLETEGIVSRYGNKRFSLGTIQSMLKNTIYIGQMKISIGEFNFDFTTPKIVDRELFRRVNNRIGTILQRKNQINKTTQFYLLRDLMYCNRCNNIMCGRKVNRKDSKGENFYYCSYSGYRWKRTGNKIDKKCSLEKSVNITKTDVLVWETMIDLFRNSHILKEEFKKESLRVKYLEIDDLKKEINKLSKKIKQVNREINLMKESVYQLEVDRMSFKIKQDRFEYLTKGLDEEINKKRDTRDRIEEELEQCYSRNTFLVWIKNYHEKIDDLSKIKKLTEQREILNNYIEKILVDYDEKTKQHSLDIHLKMKLFNDKLVFKNIDNKKEGYDIIEGESNKVIKFRRSKDVSEWNKKKRLTTIH